MSYEDRLALALRVFEAFSDEKFLTPVKVIPGSFSYAYRASTKHPWTDGRQIAWTGICEEALGKGLLNVLVTLAHEDQHHRDIVGLPPRRGYAEIMIMDAHLFGWDLRKVSEDLAEVAGFDFREQVARQLFNNTGVLTNPIRESFLFPLVEPISFFTQRLEEITELGEQDRQEAAEWLAQHSPLIVRINKITSVGKPSFGQRPRSFFHKTG